MSIKEWFNKQEIRVAMLVVLLVLSAYGVGYIMGYDSSRPPIVIESANP